MADRVSPPSWTEWARTPNERTASRQVFDDLLGELRKDGMIDVRGSLFVHLAKYAYLQTRNAVLEVAEHNRVSKREADPNKAKDSQSQARKARAAMVGDADHEDDGERYDQCEQDTRWPAGLGSREEEDKSDETSQDRRREALKDRE